jgi:uncharacterized protein YidB (DUF937 family)
MGLFDQLAGGLLNNSGSNENMQNNVLRSSTNLISGSESGGLSGLVQTFQEKGIGDVVASWISTGKNLPTNANQIQEVLGSPKIQQIAQQLGMSSADASNALAQFLPQVVDKLTPNGSMPADDLISQGLDLLKGKLFG